MPEFIVSVYRIWDVYFWVQILYFIVSPIIRSSTAWVVLTFQVYLGRFIYRKENTVQSYATRLLANNSWGIDLTWNRLLFFFYWKYYVQIPNSFGSNLFNKTLFSRRNLCKKIFFVMKQTSYDIFLCFFFFSFQSVAWGVLCK